MASQIEDDQPIHDAAVLLVIDEACDAPKVLMGRRHSNLAFMANKVVFPGGRVDPIDHQLDLPETVALRPETLAALNRKMTEPTPSTLPRALALTAIRETAEETGALLAHSREPEEHPSVSDISQTASPDDPWAPFLLEGHVPAIDHLHYFFRAITPPGQSRRFDTRFFLASASLLVCGPSEEACGELGAVGWFSFEQARQTELAVITRIVLDEAESRLEELRLGQISRDLPFYYFEKGERVRELIPAGV